MTESIFTARNITPSAEQLAVQTTRAKYVLVEANAGAAKTTSLALRIGQALARGAKPSAILVLTYTEPAVGALRQQLRFVGVPTEAIAAIHIHTFDTFSEWALNAIEGPGVLKLETQEQVKPYVERAVERAQALPDERYPSELAVSTQASVLVEGLLQSFALIKGRMLIEQLPEETRITPEVAEDLGFDYATLRFRAAYEGIREGGHPDRPAFRAHGDATYDLARAAMLEELGHGESPLAMGLALIAVDEMHDTNRGMFTVLKALLQSNRRAAFIGVGDRDQVIHSMAGAEAEFMRAHFTQEIGPPTRLPLTATHRFGPALAAAVGALSSKPYAAFQHQETQIAHLHAENARVMAGQIARLAREHMAQKQLDEMRILLRRPEYSILLERELSKLGVDYSCRGFQPFLQRPEVLLIRGLHAYCIDNFTGFATKPLRVATLNAMMLFAGALIESSETRHLDDVTAQRRAIDEAASEADGMRDFIDGQILRNASSSALPRLRKAISVLKLQDMLAFDQEFTSALDASGLAASVLVRKHDIEQVHRNVEQFVRLAVSEDAPLDDVFRLFSEMEARRASARSNHRVTLSSIAVSKGLEFDHVVIPHLTMKEFAGGVSATENRNLLYVAMTRARHRLTLAYDPGKPSRYLLEAGLV